MNWPWRRRQQSSAEPPQKRQENPRVVTTDEDLARAERAARLAAMHLQEARERRSDVDDRVNKITQLQRQNGFAELIRNALRS